MTSETMNNETKRFQLVETDTEISVWDTLKDKTEGRFSPARYGHAFDLCRMMNMQERINELEARALAAEARVAGLEHLLWSPVNERFAEGVIREAGHQVERWGTEHDAGKAPQDWFWLIGYLAGKALRAAIGGSREKALHHCISTAAVCANWHSHISGAELRFTPGLSTDRRETKPPAPEGGGHE